MKMVYQFGQWYAVADDHAGIERASVGTTRADATESLAKLLRTVKRHDEREPPVTPTSHYEPDSERGTDEATELICERCRRPWKGTRDGTYMDELRQQDHKGPQDVLIANCCNRIASGWRGVRPMSAPVHREEGKADG